MASGECEKASTGTDMTDTGGTGRGCDSGQSRSGVAAAEDETRIKYKLEATLEQGKQVGRDYGEESQENGSWIILWWMTGTRMEAFGARNFCSMSPSGLVTRVRELKGDLGLEKK